jgi:HD superfamily phosphohydrolase
MKEAKKMYEIRDPVHGTLQFSEAEKAIINHPYIQRLRYIHQLGFVFFVYPGATHDRFSHALGAMHIAGRLWTHIVESSRELLLKTMTVGDIEYLSKVVRLAGLLHDSGHGPFSHTSESLLPKLHTLEVPQDWYKKPINEDEQAAHEDYSVMVIASLAKTEEHLLTFSEAQDIASLIHHRINPSEEWKKRFSRAVRSHFNVHEIVQSLVSGELDCDRMDYLMRDAHFTGVPYGFYDLDRLINALSLVKLPKSNEVHLALDYTGTRAFEDFLLARYHMLLQVYFHKTANCFDYFLEQAFKTKELSYTIPSTMAEFADLRESTVVEQLFTAAKDPKNVWSWRLVYRRPATLVFSSGMLYENGDKKSDEKTLLNKIKEICKQKNILPIIVSSSQHLYHVPNSFDKKKAQLFVVKRVMGENYYEPIDKYSRLLQKYNEEIHITDVFILKEDYPSAEKELKRLLADYQEGVLGF